MLSRVSWALAQISCLLQHRALLMPKRCSLIARHVMNGVSEMNEPSDRKVSRHLARSVSLFRFGFLCLLCQRNECQHVVSEVALTTCDFFERVEWVLIKRCHIAALSLHASSSQTQCVLPRVIWAGDTRSKTVFEIGADFEHLYFTCHRDASLYRKFPKNVPWKETKIGQYGVRIS